MLHVHAPGSCRNMSTISEQSAKSFREVYRNTSCSGIPHCHDGLAEAQRGEGRCGEVTRNRGAASAAATLSRPSSRPCLRWTPGEASGEGAPSRLRDRRRALLPRARCRSGCARPCSCMLPLSPAQPPDPRSSGCEVLAWETSAAMCPVSGYLSAALRNLRMILNTEHAYEQ